ncbi:hypothetical protein, partial [Candidatus Frankia alpina]|uniref:hypothetical protein n=1 Tax=Candidatus Frankia alpina TaxID=2699483 RepID=UPI001967776D
MAVRPSGWASTTQTGVAASGRTAIVGGVDALGSQCGEQLTAGWVPADDRHARPAYRARLVGRPGARRRIP